MTIQNFINQNSIENLSNITMENPFKTYKPLDKGNSKLEPNILSFSLIPEATCSVKCKGCYDKRSLRYPSVQQKRQYNTYLAINEPEKLKNLIVKQVLKSRNVNHVRIHVGGDFFSIEYVTMWAEIVAMVHEVNPDINFYTYTKSKFTDELRMSNINVVNSIVKGLGFNFGPKEKLQNFMTENKGYTLCPATMGDKDVKCGVTCTACMTNEKVLFVEH